jgi:GPH family glycoside/pentoside/hexuronide:cation symporter
VSIATAGSTAFTWRQGWRYGLMGLPLAFVALPLYVLLPNHYAREFGVPLATLGVLLLLARLFDAFIDPLLGRWSDGLFARSPAVVLRWGAAAALALGLGFAALFFPPVRGLEPLLVWASAALALTYVAYSALSVLHQSWGARLGGDEVQRSRVVAWREGLGLLGVVIASISPVALGLPITTALLFIALAAAWIAWGRAMAPPVVAVAMGGRPSMTLPWSRPAFRSLMAVFVVNGIASALPATLLLFFVQDRLQAPPVWEPLFLGSYFLCAALAIPVWLKLVARIGLARTWGVGMLLSIAVFAFALALGAGDYVGFLLVCALSGIALGTDLAIPAALLAGTIADNGDRGQAEGAYFGWWNFATKLNLALAAGVALPVLGALGYVPGTRDPQALQLLSMAYCLLPCALKLLAAFLLYGLILRKDAAPPHHPPQTAMHSSGTTGELP